MTKCEVRSVKCDFLLQTSLWERGKGGGRGEGRPGNVTTDDYLVTMTKNWKTVGVAELKARLSAYLREARRGPSVTICDRDTPVARLLPVEASTPLIVRARSSAFPSLQAVPLPPPLWRGVDAAAILLEDR